MSALELPYVEALDIFETGDTRGMSKDSVELLPILKITSENSKDCSGEKIICSVCLLDIQIGETVWSLPFYLTCSIYGDLFLYSAYQITFSIFQMPLFSESALQWRALPLGLFVGIALTDLFKESITGPP
ncbi:NEP1-interacting protein-like 1 [Platanthera guangdongensis]|uniref:NEP1-interacting protein-like 1 n=1 Tax=Platanthera guangdongensis TaxID=2320717 RepID=A0ABR2M572_9ASPA